MTANAPFLNAPLLAFLMAAIADLSKEEAVLEAAIQKVLAERAAREAATTTDEPGGES